MIETVGELQAKIVELQLELVAKEWELAVIRGEVTE
jgi:hypothetical protein